MAKNILKEAIADAKAVREVALANAKAALEEAFTPKLQSMLSAKLSETLNEDEDELEENFTDETMDETFVEEEVTEIAGMDSAEDQWSEEGEGADLDEEIDLEEILNELELEEGEDSKEETVEEAKAEEVDEEIEEAVGKPNHKAEYVQDVMHKADDIHAGLNEGENFDLDALLEEINNLDENEEDEVTEEVEEGYPDPHSSEEDIEFWKQNSEGTEPKTEVLGIAAGVAGLIAAAGGLGALEAAAEDSEWQAKYPKVANALKGLQSMGATAGQSMRREQEERDAELEETKAALETVRTELNEVNLLNSKLLYVNRIFKANTLDEVQKLRVVETLDNASNVKEAKLIYETIKDTFNVANTKKTSFQNKTKSLKEGIGMASKAAGTSTAPKKEVIAESNDMVNRFQKLANITIKQ